MKPIVTSLISALVGAALVVIGVLIVAVPAILMWMISFQLAGDPFTFAGGVNGVWLLGHGVPLEFHFSAEEALGFGAAAEAVFSAVVTAASRAYCRNCDRRSSGGLAGDG